MNPELLAVIAFIIGCLIGSLAEACWRSRYTIKQDDWQDALFEERQKNGNLTRKLVEKDQQLAAIRNALEGKE